MKMQEIKEATELLADRTDRVEVTGSDTDGGLVLTAYWLDGSGQRLFYSLGEVKDHIANR